MGELGAGMCVTLHGLKGAAELNGRTGVVAVQDSTSGRWTVDIDARGPDEPGEDLEGH